MEKMGPGSYHYEGAIGHEGETFACSICGVKYSGIAHAGGVVHSCRVPRDHPEYGTVGMTFTVGPGVEIIVEGAVPYRIVSS